ncbi:MAG: signal peptidase II [Candidatus Wallbacteria bacterium HGW-Wallbacteria-1]|jgi:signal peptidase II|uniref:Lipoprotein signal peptidase n=1 Tax=Candidatus Wallbacteria bacterium HGW-Wallbacteria-1 TaxID=2013854 RepID=A0A2N1PT73_9BACT|nr:MAG: signal peptidase II [Candidatus Wallbacteria bacterium HGW-Wallbacteria-1]
MGGRSSHGGPSFPAFHGGEPTLVIDFGLIRMRMTLERLQSYLLHLPYFFLATLLVGADQYTKYLAVKRIAYGSTIEIVPNFFNLTYVKNYGAAFGLFQNQLAIFVVVAVVAISVIVVYSFMISEKEYLLQFGLSMLLGGAIGNFIDRLKLGYVIDFLNLHYYRHHWPVFNVADIAIDLGVAFILIKFLFLSGDEADEEVAVRSGEAEGIK